jgi:hypothetical protein
LNEWRTKKVALLNLVYNIRNSYVFSSFKSKKFIFLLVASIGISGPKKFSTKIPVPKKWSGTACFSDNGEITGLNLIFQINFMIFWWIIIDFLIDLNWFYDILWFYDVLWQISLFYAISCFMCKSSSYTKICVNKQNSYVSFVSPKKHVWLV